MSRKNETGRLGEALAAKYLEAQGFEILHRNLRIEHLETDIAKTKTALFLQRSKRVALRAQKRATEAHAMP